MRAADFNLAADRTALSDRGREIAHAHLVLGVAQPTLAERYGVTQGRVAQLCAAIRAAAKPRVSITLTVPRDRVADLKRYARTLR